jgi:membrane peptidoglycan carboxypeptidase
MNPSYGDSTNSASGRARVPDPGGGHDPDVDGYGDPHGSGDPYGTSWRGSSGEGSGAVGSASVRPAAGSAAVSGRASVGRASVGRPAVAGRASVGTGYDDYPSGDPYGDVIEGPGDGDRGGPGGPGGPGSPGGPGRGRRGKGPKGKKNRRRRNLILAGAAVFIILSGLVVVGSTYYYDSVPEPNQIALPQSTTVFYSDGTTPMAKLGDQNRTIIDGKQIPDTVKHAVVAAEDNTFYENSGIDFKGIVRAAWNNVTGGDRQGASTITQQYVRKAFDLQGVTYARKIREAVMAVKINQKYSKDQILTFYLNTVYFGRGCYGIECAALAYFGKHASALNAAEAMVLAGVIKQPEGTDGFDPAMNLKNAQDRWAKYIKPNMVKLGFMTDKDAAATTYPTDILKPDSTSSAAEFGKDTPSGFVVHHVMDELSHQSDVKLGDLKTQGYKIVTTVNKQYEDAAIAIADATRPGSIMSKQPARLQAALVAIEPGTGKVLAYFGGSNGAGLDNAGIYSDPVLENGEPSGLHFSPGSTNKVYTMTTALSQHISIDSYWDGPPSKEFPGRGDAYAKQHNGPGPVTNSDGDACPKDQGYVCTMQYALQVSTNTVFYGVGQKVGPDNVIDMMHKMGVDHIWAPVIDASTGAAHDQRYDLDKYAGKDLFPSKLGGEVAIGQYGITVEDNATGMATLAAGGVHTQTHFVDYVMKGSQVVYKARTKQATAAQLGLTKAEVDDATWAMSTVIDKGLPKNRLSGGRQAASKTGTWEWCNSASTCKQVCHAPTCKGKTSANSDAWYAGFTPQVATVVHIGSKDPSDRSVAYYASPGHEANMNGANTPGDIWKKFMDTVLNGKPKVALPQPKHVGRVDGGNAASPQPSDPPTDPNGNGGGDNPPGNGQPCQQPPICVTLPPSPDPSPSRKHGGGAIGN